MKVCTLCLVFSAVLLACLVTEGQSGFFSARKATTSVIRGARKGARGVAGAAKKGARFVGGAVQKGARVVGGAVQKGARVVGGAVQKGAKFVGGAAKKGARFVGGAALGTRDMYRGYRDMRRANWKKSNKYFHARANYDAARHRPGGRWAAN